MHTYLLFKESVTNDVIIMSLFAYNVWIKSTNIIFNIERFSVPHCAQMAYRSRTTAKEKDYHLLYAKTTRFKKTIPSIRIVELSMIVIV